MRFLIRNIKGSKRPRQTGEKIAGVPVDELSPRARAALSATLAENASLKRHIDLLQERLGEAQALADLDPLVPVFNRRAFERELSRTLSMNERYGHAAAFVFIDLDGFKQINDQYGHAAGDAALIHAATLLLAQVRESDIVGRLGGDEFGVILAQAGLPEAEAKAQSLMQALRETPVSYEDISLSIEASCGIYPFSPGEKAGQIIARADEAMYAQKALRRASKAGRIHKG